AWLRPRERDIPPDRAGRGVHAHRPQAYGSAKVTAERWVLVEELADLRPENLRHRLACGLRRASTPRPLSEAFGELSHELMQLGAQALGVTAIGELLGVVELGAQVRESGAVLPASTLVGCLVEGFAREADGQIVVRPRSRVRRPSDELQHMQLTTGHL